MSLRDPITGEIVEPSHLPYEPKKGESGFPSVGPVKTQTMEVTSDMLENMKRKMLNLLVPGKDRRYYMSDMDFYGLYNKDFAMYKLNKLFVQDSLAGTSSPSPYTADRATAKKLYDMYGRYLNLNNGVMSYEDRKKKMESGK